MHLSTRIGVLLHYSFASELLLENISQITQFVHSLFLKLGIGDINLYI